VLTHLAEHRVGIMWVGGEPTMNPLLYPAAQKANELGLQQCLFTNGSLLNREHAAVLFDSDFVFVRVSLNAVTPDVHRRHHDYDQRRDYARHVRENLARLAEIRSERRSPTLLGVSVVVDEVNIADLQATAEHLCDLTARFGPGSIDYAIFRPAFPFYSAQLDVRADTAQRFMDVVGEGAPLRQRMVDAGIDVVVPEGSRPDAEHEPDDLGCLSAGWFGEVTPNGDMVACSDRYGNPDYFVGNVAEFSIDQLWSGPRRREVLDLARSSDCFGTYCPHNGRGHFLNRIFRQIEEFRRDGRMDEVRRWVDDLRAVLPRPSHSFFL
jgi:MoaA/NifB/PqqE/SkfB family radical SAM enzyme